MSTSKRERRAQRARERVLRVKWARAYCKVYGAPSVGIAATWRTMGHGLAARGLVPGVAA
jgi:hypothetical protein